MIDNCLRFASHTLRLRNDSKIIEIQIIDKSIKKKINCHPDN